MSHLEKVENTSKKCMTKNFCMTMYDKNRPKSGKKCMTMYDKMKMYNKTCSFQKCMTMYDKMKMYDNV